MKIYILIQGVITALLNAHSLAIINKNTPEQDTAFEEMFWMMGKYTLEEQKRSIYKLSSLTLLLNVPYCIIAFIYFNWNPIPSLATLLLACFVLVDFFHGMKRLRRVQKITEIAHFTWLDKVILLASIVLLGIQLGFL